MPSCKQVPSYLDLNLDRTLDCQLLRQQKLIAACKRDQLKHPQTDYLGSKALSFITVPLELLEYVVNATTVLQICIYKFVKTVSFLNHSWP